MVSIMRLLKEYIRELLSENSSTYDGFIKKYDNSPDVHVSHDEVKKAGVDLLRNKAIDYHLVYGQLVAQEDGVDIKFWSPQREQWEDISFEERQHPVKIHSPK